MEKWIINYNEKNSEPTSMVRVASKAIKMYVEENGILRKEDILNVFFPNHIKYTESRREQFLLSKEEYKNKVAENSNNRNRYAFDEEINLIDDDGVAKTFFCTTQFNNLEDEDASLFKIFTKNLLNKGFGFQEAIKGNGVTKNNQPKASNILHGPDKNCNHVRYNQNVSEFEMIPELASILENELEKIISFASNNLKLDNFKFDRIPVILKKEIPDDDIYQLSLDDRTTILYNRINLLGEELLLDDYKKIMNTIFIHFNVTGKYSSFPKCIVIYYNNISAVNREEYIQKVIGLLAHECFHFIHNMIIGDEKFDENNKYAHDLREALAEVFSFLYCSDQIQKYHNPILVNVREERTKEWQKYFGSKWPYSYALYFFLGLEPVQTIDKFKRIVKETGTENPKTIFESLVKNI